MNNKCILILVLFISSVSIIKSQNNNDTLVQTARIISSNANLTDVIIDSISVQSLTRIYPHGFTKIPVKKYLYTCNLIIKLNSDDYLFQEPIKVMCILPNGRVQEQLFNSACNPINIDEFYDYSFDILSANRINGWARIKLLKYITDGNYDDRTIAEYDEATLFIQ